MKTRFDNLLLTIVLTAAALPLGGCVVSIGDRVDTPHAAAPAAATTADLVVRFEKIETPTGQIMMSLFDKGDAYDAGGKPVRLAAVPVEGTAATARFEGLAPGDYAIKAFHDVDGDGAMATNPFGIPLEPYAFSNDAKAEGGPAKWEAARFAVAPGANTVTIAIK